MFIVITLLKYLLLWVVPPLVIGRSSLKNSDIDWIYCAQEFSAIQRHLRWTSISHWDFVLTSTAHHFFNQRHRQSRCNRALYLLRGWDVGTKSFTIHIRHGDGYPVLSCRRYFKDPSAFGKPESRRYIATTCVSGNGCNVIHICLLLFDGMG